MPRDHKQLAIFTSFLSEQCPEITSNLSERCPEIASYSRLLVILREDYHVHIEPRLKEKERLLDRRQLHSNIRHPQDESNGPQNSPQNRSKIAHNVTSNSLTTGGARAFRFSSRVSQQVATGLSASLRTWTNSLE